MKLPKSLVVVVEDDDPRVYSGSTQFIEGLARDFDLVSGAVLFEPGSVLVALMGVHEWTYQAERGNATVAPLIAIPSSGPYDLLLRLKLDDTMHGIVKIGASFKPAQEEPLLWRIRYGLGWVAEPVGVE